MYVDHPLIRPNTVLERGYQRSLADSCYYYSSLVVLPTGLGKTIIALLVMAETLHRQGGKCLFLAPTKPLVDQHASFLRDRIIGPRVVQMSGEMDPLDREREWRENDLIVSTPQVVANDLRSGRIDLGEVRLIVFDEAHRAVGRYAYVAVARAYAPLNRRALGITASPGGTKARIRAVCDNLNLINIETRSEKDDDVAQHIHDIDLEIMHLELPERVSEIAGVLRAMYADPVEQLRAMGFVKVDGVPKVRYLIELHKSLRARMWGRKKNGYVFKAMGLQSMAIKVGHALELVETQGTGALEGYLKKLKAEARAKSGPKASKRIVSSPRFGELERLLAKEEEAHPKLEVVADLIALQLAFRPHSRVMVFTNYRDSCETVSRRLSCVEGVKASKLIGQTDRGTDLGQCQREQVEVLSRLRTGDLNTVVATCVGEEGLDVSDTDLVIFYEPVPSEIRSIQRRGRTGRSGPGRVVVLVTRGTSDESSLRAGLSKEASMRRNLLKVKQEWGERVLEAPTVLQT